MLVTQLRSGNLLRDRDRRVTRKVRRVHTFCRVFCEPMEGQPEYLDFSLEGPDARQWVSKGVPLYGVGGGMTEDELARSWDYRDDATSQGVPPYPRGDDA